MKMSFLVGAGIGLMNVSILYFTWKRVLAKKSLVLPVSVIVFKYPILAAIFYVLISRHIINLAGLLIGLGAFMPAILFASFFQRVRGPKKKTNVSLKIDA